MRGSRNHQLMTLLRLLVRIGESRHEAKLKHGGASPYIHSAGTLDKIFQRLRHLSRWLWAKGVTDFERLDSDMIRLYLGDRLEHHLLAGNCRQSFLVELSALATLERSLNAFSSHHRGGANKYDFKKLRKESSQQSKSLPRKAPGRVSRAILEPMTAIELIKNSKHKLMALLQWESGCRAEGVGAPRRGTNPFTMNNFLNPETENEFGLVSDPVTNQMVAPLWTLEKGGKLAFKFCSPKTHKKITSFFISGETLKSDYPNYLKSLNQALSDSSQGGKGVGTHGLRFAFARRRFKECLKHGYTDEQAKLLVSHEMSHNRADVTETYLK